MKILHLITRLDFGGSSENVILSAQGSAKAGHEVLIASGPSSALTEMAGDIRVAHVVLPCLVRAVHPWKDLRAFFQIFRLIRDWKPDIVHTHSSKAGILGRWAAWFCRSPRERLYSLPAAPGGNMRPVPRIIHTPHGHVFYGYFGAFKSAFYLALERTTAPITNDLVALSEGEKRESLERGVGRQEQWTVIHSGVALSGHRAPSPLPPPQEGEGESGVAAIQAKIPKNAVIIGCIARLEPVKGIGVLIDAAARVHADPVGKNVVFLIIGDGELRPALEARSRALSLAGTVVFAGYQKDPWSFLSSMDVYAQPSLNEGMGKTLVMAQYAGLPVVASRVCGIADVVRDGETGLLTPPSDPATMAEAILRLLKDEALRKSMGQKAKAWIMSQDETGRPRFSADSMVARLKKLYGP